MSTREVVRSLVVGRLVSGVFDIQGEEKDGLLVQGLVGLLRAD